jgi:hypothetical protein
VIPVIALFRDDQGEDRMNRRDTLLATVALVAVAAVTLIAAHIPGLAQAADVLRIEARIPCA